MSDDIVTRLRELGRYVNTEGGRWFEPITTEAADEIERLRQLADNLAHHLQGYVCHCNMSKCKCGYDDVMDLYREIRG